ncbi:MAG TPA: bifunctional phosphoribosylaminoimidazolecarboxamide formyltransferase/IMP cyclohydrolase [Actinomycetota bacterium]|nr:bifunctional phosphoribosylaminoimidazolecarboxamide formyltransferase/IMP cyclohydrolase [Actinomycetota bacterium]
MRIRRALISVSDKTGLDTFAAGLAAMGVTIVSTGRTAHHLSRAGVPVTPVADVTGVPELLEGRVKTLHPHIHAGILADRRKPQHLAQLKAMNVPLIDLVVCNLYPFRETVAAGAAEDSVLEQIDIGGPAMVRAAAKNYHGVAVIVNPDRYPTVLAEMQASRGSLAEETLVALAAEAFSHTAEYDFAVASWLSGHSTLPDILHLALKKQFGLRYGENPHQNGAFYSAGDPGWVRLQGKDLSYTNLLDLDAAWRLVTEFERPAVAIVKHTNACGCALGSGVEDAYRRALEADRRSAFGGIVAANREVDGPTAGRITEIMTEIVIAPSFTPEALATFAERKNLRVVHTRKPPARGAAELRTTAGGVLVQDLDTSIEARGAMKVAGRVQPAEEDWDDLIFAWTVCKHLKSNAVALANRGQLVGMGAGQTSRVEAVEMAARRAGERTIGAVCASDGFFPFRDNVDAAAAAGVRAIIEPGGSVRDAEVIAAADEHGIPIVLTGVRHFRH